MAADDIHPLQLAGEALYGPRFAPELEIALKISNRTLRRWLATEPAGVPAGVWQEVRALLAVRMRTLLAVRNEVDWIIARLPQPPAPP